MGERELRPVLVSDRTSTGQQQEAVLVAARSSTGRTSDQYWLVFAPAKRLSDCTLFEDEIEGIEPCGRQVVGRPSWEGYSTYI